MIGHGAFEKKQLMTIVISIAHITPMMQKKITKARTTESPDGSDGSNDSGDLMSIVFNVVVF